MYHYLLNLSQKFVAMIVRMRRQKPKNAGRPGARILVEAMVRHFNAGENYFKLLTASSS